MQNSEFGPGLTSRQHFRTSRDLNVRRPAACVDAGARADKKAGETDERLWSLAAWRESLYFTDAERTALPLAEAVTRLSDRADAVTDEIWDAVADHYDEQGLAAIIFMIATTNLFNRPQHHHQGACRRELG